MAMPRSVDSATPMTTYNAVLPTLLITAWLRKMFDEVPKAREAGGRVERVNLEEGLDDRERGRDEGEADDEDRHRCNEQVGQQIGAPPSAGAWSGPRSSERLSSTTAPRLASPPRGVGRADLRGAATISPCSLPGSRPQRSR